MSERAQVVKNVTNQVYEMSALGDKTCFPNTSQVHVKRMHKINMKFHERHWNHVTNIHSFDHVSKMDIS